MNFLIPDKKLTDNEVINCKNCIHYIVCVFYNAHSQTTKNCGDYLDKDLINRLQAEKEALINGQETLQKYIAEQQAENERLKDELNILSQKRFNIFEKVEYVGKIKAETKAKAQKEFAEAVKQDFDNPNIQKHGLDYVNFLKRIVDKRLEKLVGE